MAARWPGCGQSPLSRVALGFPLQKAKQAVDDLRWADHAGAVRFAEVETWEIVIREHGRNGLSPGALGLVPMGRQKIHRLVATIALQEDFPILDRAAHAASALQFLAQLL